MNLKYLTKKISVINANKLFLFLFSRLLLVLIYDHIKNVSHKFCGIFDTGNMWIQFLYR